MLTDLNLFCVTPSATIEEAIGQMNRNKLGITLIVDAQFQLLGTVTDGDIRRAVLAHVDLTSMVSILLERKKGTGYDEPLFGKIDQKKWVHLDILKKTRLSHLPIVNEKHQVVGLVTSDEFLGESFSSLNAVVMAGGLGTRLRPLTEDLPKPMLPVGNKPLLEIIIGQLKSVGIQKVNVTTHHKPEKIKEHFGNGKEFGVDISYVSEDRPLGTAGALGLLETLREPLLVVNGDILTHVDFKAMMRFHQEHNADMTVGVRVHELAIPYGVLECEGVEVKQLKEKPHYQFLINAGLYLLEPEIHRYIPSGEYYHMTDLILRLLEEGRRVVSFPIHEAWLDVGEYAQYQKAQQEPWLTKV